MVEQRRRLEHSSSVTNRRSEVQKDGWEMITTDEPLSKEEDSRTVCLI
jgi:hypothetical protein